MTRGRLVRRDQASLAAATGAGVLAALLSVALIDGGPEMVMTADASPVIALSTPGPVVTATTDSLPVARA